MGAIQACARYLIFRHMKPCVSFVFPLFIRLLRWYNKFTVWRLILRRTTGIVLKAHDGAVQQCGLSHVFFPFLTETEQGTWFCRCRVLQWIHKRICVCTMSYTSERLGAATPRRSFCQAGAVLFISVQPFAYVVSCYTCQYGDRKGYNVIHVIPPSRWKESTAPLL